MPTHLTLIAFYLQIPYFAGIVQDMANELIDPIGQSVLLYKSLAAK